MKPVETVWRELVQRRLVPVAIVLIAALVAIPFLLAKDPAPVAPAAVDPVRGDASLTSAANTKTASVVSLAADGEPTDRRRVLGARKNPFEPAAAPKVAKTRPDAGPAQTTQTTTLPSSSGGAQTTGPASTGSPTGVDSPGSTPPAASAPPAEPKPRYELYSLTVRFGDSSSEFLPKMNLPRLKALPDAQEPIIIYLGMGKDNKSALFLVDASAEPQGDGTCRPNPANCEMIELREGETEFFDIADETGAVTSQYQLDLVDIKRRTTASAGAARAARTRVSTAGRKIVRARQAENGPLRYRYDARSGKVRKLDRKAYKALVARTAKVTASFSAGF